MAQVYRIVDDVVASAKAREERDFAEAAAALGGDSRALVAGDLGFAVMHMLLCTVAEGLTKHGYGVRITRSGGEVTVRLNNRSVTCAHFVGEPVVRLRFLGLPTLTDWEVTWTPPISTDPAAVHAAAGSYAERIARHLVDG